MRANVAIETCDQDQQARSRLSANAFVLPMRISLPGGQFPRQLLIVLATLVDQRSRGDRVPLNVNSTSRSSTRRFVKVDCLDTAALPDGQFPR